MNRIIPINTVASFLGGAVGVLLAAGICEILKRVWEAVSPAFFTNHQNHHSKPIQNATVLSLKE